MRRPASGPKCVPARYRLVAVLLVVSVFSVSFQGFKSFVRTAEAASADVVISQVYGGGGNSGATIKNDFIELFNRGTSTVNLSGWSVQYASSAGTSWAVTPLSGTLAPGRYYLVQEAAGTGGTALNGPDATGAINMSATAGKVAVVNSTAALAGSCPAVVDFVGFGGANCFETAPTATLSNTTAALRAGGGCNDTDANSADFTVGAPNPRNSATPAQTCTAANNAPTITAPANPLTTVAQDAPTFNVTLSGSDDNNVFNWSATAGAGVASVVVGSGQGTAAVTYAVTLAPGFSGTATFTATLSDNVNAAVTRAVNISVTPLVANLAPSVVAPSSPAATVAQDAAPFAVSLAGTDDNNIFNWSAVPGTGVSAVSVASGQGTSAVTYTVTLTAGFSGTATFGAVLSDGVNPQVTQPVTVAVTPAPPPPLDHVVISQVYGGGGNSGAAFQNDFVELFNPDTVAHDLSGWTIQYGSATGTTWQVQPVGGVMAPGEYYLVKLASNGAVGSVLPAANVNGSLNLSGTNGKVALVRAGDPLDGCAPADPTLVDMVGYGSTANCREGAANAPTLSNALAALRKNGGFSDTNVNGADFVTATPNPRRTTPITELAPSVLSSDPRAGFSNVPRDASITVTFTEPVTVDAGWFDINCAQTGAHNSATVAPGGANAWIIIPNENFRAGEQCTVGVAKEFVHDADLDDATPAEDLLTRGFSASFTVATGTEPAYTPEVHLTMGNPSGAEADRAGSPNNYLMLKPEFALSYNRDRGTPNWVSWHLADEWVGTLARVDTFRADPAVPSDWYRVTHVDYTNSGFDRGHMTPNADRDKETSSPINQATFLMSNMVPQAPDNNQGPWANLENYLRTLLPANEFYIVAGGAGTGGTGSSGYAETIAGGHISVPASTWKVALVIPKGDADVSRVKCTARTIAVVMPNTQGIRNNDWAGYLTNVDAVEALTGYDFFSELPDAVEACVEAGTNGVNPPGAKDAGFTTDEDTAADVTLTGLASDANALTYTVVSAPEHGTLAGAGAARVYTPAANFHGADSFTFRVSVTDAAGTRTSRTATVSLLVNEVNDAPTLAGVPASADVPELAAYTFTAHADDVDGQALTYALVGAPAGATIDPQTGVFNWTPTEEQGGTNSTYGFTVRVTDGTVSADSPVGVTVAEVNQAPTLEVIEPKAVSFGGTLAFTAAGADADLPAQGLSYGLTGTVPAGASVNPATGEFNWTPAAAQAGHVYSFGVRVTDGGGLSAERPLSVAVSHEWSGFLQPVNPNGGSVFKLGQTVPVKFQLTGASAGVTNAVARLYVAKVNDSVAGTEEAAGSTSNATEGNLFRYADGQYVFNLGTKGLTAGTYQLRVDMGDGVVRAVNVSVR